MKQRICIIMLAAVLFAFTGCAKERDVLPEDFAFSVSTETMGRTIEYHSEGNLLVKSDLWEHGGAEHTAELVLADEQMQAAWELFDAMDLGSYPDAPEIYNPGTANGYPKTHVKLWVRTGEGEKMIFSENISFQGEASSADGNAFMHTVEELLKMITGTEEYLSMPDWTT